MAVDMFLKLAGVDGESTNNKYSKWIDVLSFSWGIADATRSADSARLSSQRKAQVSDFSITKYLDKSSPKLFEMACSGEHIPELNFSLVRAGEKQEEFYKIKLTDILISGVQNSGGTSSLPTESISFSFGSSLITAVDERGQATSTTSCGAASFEQLKKQD